MWEEIVYEEESFDHSRCEVRALSPCMEELQMCSVCRCAVKSHMDFFQTTVNFNIFTIPIAAGFGGCLGSSNSC